MNLCKLLFAPVMMLSLSCSSLLLVGCSSEDTEAGPETDPVTADPANDPALDEDQTTEVP